MRDNEGYGRRRLAVLTTGIRGIQTLPELLNDVELISERRPAPSAIDGVLAWGRKPSAELAERFARRHELAVIRLEDGFLRSVELGHQAPPLSVVVDEVGIYYDATGPSRLEQFIKRPHTERELERARQIARLWRDGRLSKYNHTRDLQAGVPEPYVLVADQTYGDVSIAYGLAGPADFARMLEAALDEHPGLRVVLKVHPDVVAGRKKGHFQRLTPGQVARLQVLATDAHPSRLLENATAVYTVTSQLGFEALMWNKPVRCFGMPFYAGWGLTIDQGRAPERRTAVGLEDLIHGALVDYPRYLDPETGRRCEPEQLMHWMAFQRRMRERFSATVYATGFRGWKSKAARAFFGGSDIQFVGASSKPAVDGRWAVWGGASHRNLNNPAPIRVEDGFIRSVGLGADNVRPVSWVMDQTGLYYDATRPSGLECILQDTVFSEADLDRAARLRVALVQGGITKYNVGAGAWMRPASKSTVVLVPGQVESDASIAYGARAVRTNMELLRVARKAHPDAWLVYKPHPDVRAGLRAAGHGEDEAARWCDEVVLDTPMDQMLEHVDVVHTLTSLTGFEALIRGKRVFCEGMPFYAGWGLTTDAYPCERRTRQLVLDELVAGALIFYPTYVSRKTGMFTTPEQALNELLEWRRAGAKPPSLAHRALARLLSLREALSNKRM